MLSEPCTWIGILLIFMGSIGNCLCITVFVRKRFRWSVSSICFITLLIADCIYLTFRVIKVLYYQQTMFNQFSFVSSCSQSFLIGPYASLAQNAPQFFIPLIHYEFYIRFSLLLISFLAVQRAIDMYRTWCQCSQRASLSYTSPIVLIVSAFSLAYALEFFSLNIFCSSSLSEKVSSHWLDYLLEHLPNESVHLADFMRNHSASDDDVHCLVGNGSRCSSERLHQLTRKSNEAVAIRMNPTVSRIFL
jgi:hypothetical protein